MRIRMRGQCKNCTDYSAASLLLGLFVFDGDHNFIGMQHAKIAPHQLAGQIRVGGFGIKQIDTVAQCITFFGEMCNPRLAHFESLGILAPCKQAGGAGNGKSGQEQQCKERKALPQLFPWWSAHFINPLRMHRIIVNAPHQAEIADWWRFQAIARWNDRAQTPLVD